MLLTFANRNWCVRSDFGLRTYNSGWEWSAGQPRSLSSKGAIYSNNACRCSNHTWCSTAHGGAMRAAPTDLQLNSCGELQPFTTIEIKQKSGCERFRYGWRAREREREIERASERERERKRKVDYIYIYIYIERERERERERACNSRGCRGTCKGASINIIIISSIYYNIKVTRGCRGTCKRGSRRLSLRMKISGLFWQISELFWQILGLFWNFLCGWRAGNSRQCFLLLLKFRDHRREP